MCAFIFCQVPLKNIHRVNHNFFAFFAGAMNKKSQLSSATQNGGEKIVNHTPGIPEVTTTPSTPVASAGTPVIVKETVNLITPTSESHSQVQSNKRPHKERTKSSSGRYPPQ